MKEETEDEKLFIELTRLYEKSTGHPLPEAKKYSKGRTLYMQGEVPNGMFYIKKGLVKITSNNHEEPITVRLVTPHTLVGFVSLVKHWDYITTATALETTEAYFIPKHLFMEALQHNGFANLVVGILCARLHERNELLAEILHKNVPERLALLLLTLDHALLDGEIDIMKKDLASVLNIKAETLSRNLLKLQKQGAITLNPKKNSIEIKSKEKLLQVAQVTD